MFPEVWVKLEPGRVKRLHFTGWSQVYRTITDPITHEPKQVPSLIMYVDEEDGYKVSKQFSVVSEKLMNELRPYLEGGMIDKYEFLFVKPALGPVAPRLVEVRLRGG